MKRFRDWWLKDHRYMTLVKAVLLALLPVLCCTVFCRMDGQSITKVWLPGCQWNDELFYYKQVESMLRYGFPLGYFGFNESRALVLSFAAWSPAIVVPWLLWGWIFGWNLLSPILCNIAILSLVFFLFVWLAKPKLQQLGVIALLLCFYTPLWRYTLSAMPEVICISSVILFYGLAIAYLREKKTRQLVLLFLLSGYMTLMRPYLILFMVLPAVILIRRKKWLGALISMISIGMVFACYAVINHYLGAAYFAPLFFTDWLEAFFTRGFFGGLYATFGKIYLMGKQFTAYTIEGFKSRLYAGTFFGVFVVISVILIWHCFADFRKLLNERKTKKVSPDNERHNRLVIELHMLFCNVAMFFAILLMYKLTEGSRHLHTFIVAEIFGIGLMDTLFYKKAVITACTFAYLLPARLGDPIVYQIPYLEEEEESRAKMWETVFDEKLLLQTENVPSFDNVIIWVTEDEKPSGEHKMVRWQYLYYLPEGFGISCCRPEYCLENLDNLESKYLATLSEGNLDLKLSGNGYQELARDDELVVYQLRD